jgi:hypothetical protein
MMSARLILTISAYFFVECEKESQHLQLLGHGNIRTVEGYTQLSESAFGRIKSPLDKLTL